MGWRVLNDGQQIRPPGGADAAVWLWTLVRNDGSEERQVEVWVSGTAMSSSTVPQIVSRARETNGQDAVARVLDWDEPPVRIKLFTDSEKPVFEGGEPGAELRELNEIAEWFDQKGIALVFTGRGIGTGAGPVDITTHSANLIDLGTDKLVGRAEAPTRLEAARKVKAQWLQKEAPSAAAKVSAPALRVDTAQVDRLRQDGIHLIWSRPTEGDADSLWMVEAYDDDAKLLDIAVQEDATDALLTIIENLLPPEGHSD